MKILLAIVLGHAVLFYLLSREGFDVDETITAFLEIIPWVFLGVEFVNYVLGADFGDSAFLVVWLGLIAVWTVAAVWFLLSENIKRRKTRWLHSSVGLSAALLR